MELDLARTTVGLGFLLVAALMDLRKRAVKDELWIMLGVLGLAFVELDLMLAERPWMLHLVTASTAILYFGVFFGEELWDEDRFHARPIRLFLYALAPILVVIAWVGTDAPSRDAFGRLITMPAMIVVAHGLYYFDLLRGGADAKALMALALLFPGVYPHIDGLPILAPSSPLEPILAIWFPFAFVVLVNSAILFLIVPIGFLVRNAARRSLAFPRALFGYRVPLDAVPKHVWFMDRVDDGRPTFVYFPRRKENRKEQIRLLRDHGFTKVWVTPQLPFVVAMLIGYVLAVVLGNLVLLLFPALVR